MRITKFEHACLLVELQDPTNRAALFDPGTMSESVLDIDRIASLDDIIITHEHDDHFSLELIKRLVDRFPKVRIIAPDSVVAVLKSDAIEAVCSEGEGVVFFDAPHEGHEPFLKPPEEIGVHYFDKISHPGDSHSFNETKEILALPVTAPWGSTDRAVQLALQLRPKHIIPIHDWHWKDEVRARMYNRLESLFERNDITFHKMETGEPIDIDL